MGINEGSKQTNNDILVQYQHDNAQEWRRGWDSNPRYPQGYNGFRDRPVRPLRHPSARGSVGTGRRRPRGPAGPRPARTYLKGPRPRKRAPPARVGPCRHPIHRRRPGLMIPARRHAHDARHDRAPCRHEPDHDRHSTTVRQPRRRNPRHRPGPAAGCRGFRARRTRLPRSP